MHDIFGSQRKFTSLRRWSGWLKLSVITGAPWTIPICHPKMLGGSRCLGRKNVDLFLSELKGFFNVFLRVNMIYDYLWWRVCDYDDDDDDDVWNPRSLWEAIGKHSDIRGKFHQLVKLCMVSLQAYFASLPHAMLSLFMSISGVDLSIDHMSQVNSLGLKFCEYLSTCFSMGWDRDWLILHMFPSSLTFDMYIFQSKLLDMTFLYYLLQIATIGIIATFPERWCELGGSH